MYDCHSSRSNLFVSALVLGAVLLMGWMLWSGLGKPNPFVDPVPTATPTPAPDPQPELVTQFELALHGEWDITDIRVDSRAIYIAVYGTGGLSTAISMDDLIEADRLLIELLRANDEGGQKVVSIMFFGRNDSGALRFFWITICTLDLMYINSAEACSGVPSDSEVPPHALRWANKPIP